MSAIALQGQEDSRLPRWINLRQLGREFDMTGPAMGKHLDALGLRSEGRPSQKAVSSGIGRLLPSSAHLQTPVIQWHGTKAIDALRKHGLQPMDSFAVFCRAAVDKASTHLLSIAAQADSSPVENWWITGQMTEHLQQVPSNKKEEFIDALVDGLTKRKNRRVGTEHLYAMLGAMGELDAHLARMVARELRSQAPEPTQRSGRHRL